MKAIDLKEKSDCLNDNSRTIPHAHLISVCKRYQKEKTCRYICLSQNGFACAKKTYIREVIDQLVKDDKMTAKSDNCEGLGDL